MEGRRSQDSDSQCERTDIAKLTQMKSKVNRLKRSPKAATLNPGQIRNTGTKRPEKHSLFCFSVLYVASNSCVKAPAFSINVILFNPVEKYFCCGVGYFRNFVFVL